MTTDAPYPIGTPGKPWGSAEIAAWRSRQTVQRSYEVDVRNAVQALSNRFELVQYGHLDHDPARYPLLALRTRPWNDALPIALVTGGVHGYETSGVHGALRFLDQHAAAYAGRCNLIVAPCVSPWAYEVISRWNPHAVDPNRSFREQGRAQEATELMRLLAPVRDRVLVHVDLHETTDTDESEFRPALAARDGVPQQLTEIPDGFYLVADLEDPQVAFQQAMIAAIAKVTHIAPADAKGNIIGSPLLAPGLIAYPIRKLGLCAGMTQARYRTTTEVYPDSPGTTPDLCTEAQAVCVCAALDFALSQTA